MVEVSDTSISRKILSAISIMLISAGVGIGVTIIIVSPYVWYMNAAAQDGPIFPPPLVALGFFGLPYALLLFPIQLFVALYEFFRVSLTGAVLLIIATVNGLLAGFLWSLVMKSSSTDATFFLSLVGVALLQSYVVHGLYWLWKRFAPRWLKNEQQTDQ